MKGQHHPKSAFNSGPKVGRGLNKNDFHQLFYSGCPLPNKNNKAAPSALAQRGGALRTAAPLGFCCFPFGSGNPE